MLQIWFYSNGMILNHLRDRGVIGRRIFWGKLHGATSRRRRRRGSLQHSYCVPWWRNATGIATRLLSVVEGEDLQPGNEDTGIGLHSCSLK